MDVRQLLNPSEREALWRRLVKHPEQVFPDAEVRRELLESSVTHVLESRGRDGDSVLIAFLDGPEGKAEGGFVLVRPQPPYIFEALDGNDLLEPCDVVADLNADGMLEIVSLSTTEEDGFLIDELMVRAVSTTQERFFTVLFNRRRNKTSILQILKGQNYTEVQIALQGAGDGRLTIRPRGLPKGYWFWRVLTSDSCGSKIQIGPVEKGEFVVKASFDRSAQGGSFSGPGGSLQEGFISMSGAPTDAHWDAFSA